ncbi:MAG: ABC transporter ATP-binding protein [Lachnospiraceae bacterium]|nr:ABC transporter ATP-binding protein [Lachnospiraceae bacterium]
MTEGNDVEVKISNVKKNFRIDGKSVEVLENVTLDIKKGEFISIVGTSGCGKSTLLRIIAGLEKSTEGEIRIGNKVVEAPSPNVGMVFQQARLFPWMRTRDNILYGISDDQNKAMSKKDKEDRVSELLDLVGLKGFEKAWPRQLSGGMQQRASIARALIGDPDVLLMDEPFGALDALNRINMQMEILKIWERDRKTVIMVTHDIDEAIFLGDKVVVMSDKPGVIKQVFNADFSRARDRTSPEFIKMKREIYSLFFENVSEQIEYYI